MELTDYREIFSKVKKDLEGLRGGKAKVEEHLAKLNIQIDSLVQTHNALAPLLGEPLLPANSAADTSLEALASASISHRVRSVLDAHVSESFTATTMRDRLGLQGWDWSKYVNPNATLHTVMMRLAKAGHAVEDTSRTNADGSKSFYSAKRNPPNPPNAGPRKAPTMPPPGSTTAEIMQAMLKGSEK
jgi:hypothetical protein